MCSVFARSGLAFLLLNAAVTANQVDLITNSNYKVVLECDNVKDNTCFKPNDIRGHVITDFTEVAVISVARGVIVPNNLPPSPVRRLEEASNLRGSSNANPQLGFTPIKDHHMDLEDFYALAPPEDLDLDEADVRRLGTCNGVYCGSPYWCAMLGCGRRRLTSVVAYAYDDNAGKQCATSSGDVGSDGNEFLYMDLNYTLTECRDECNMRSDCVAFEHITTDGKCNLWTQLPESFIDHAPATCDIKHKVAYNQHTGFCRTASGDPGDNNNEFVRYYGYGSKSACEHKCTLDSNCLAYEHFSNNNNCEIWTQAPGSYEANSNANCNVKVTGPQTANVLLKDLIGTFPLTPDEDDCLSSVTCQISWIIG